MTRWLDAEEQRTWRAWLAATRLLGARLERELQRDCGIPHTYYEILVLLSEAPGGTLRMSALADASQSSRSRLSHAVARMEAGGWVRREECPGDRRGALARLTDEGRAALEDAAPRHVASVRRALFDHLAPDEVRLLGDLMARVAAADPCHAVFTPPPATPCTVAPPATDAPPATAAAPTTPAPGDR